MSEGAPQPSDEIHDRSTGDTPEAVDVAKEPVLDNLLEESTPEIPAAGGDDIRKEALGKLATPGLFDKQEMPEPSEEATTVSNLAEQQLPEPTESSLNPASTSPEAHPAEAEQASSDELIVDEGAKEKTSEPAEHSNSKEHTKPDVEPTTVHKNPDAPLDSEVDLSVELPEEQTAPAKEHTAKSHQKPETQPPDEAAALEDDKKRREKSSRKDVHTENPEPVREEIEPVIEDDADDIVDSPLDHHQDEEHGHSAGPHGDTELDTDHSGHEHIPEPSRDNIVSKVEARLHEKRDRKQKFAQRIEEEHLTEEKTSPLVVEKSAEEVAKELEAAEKVRFVERERRIRAIKDEAERKHFTEKPVEEQDELTNKWSKEKENRRDLQTGIHTAAYEAFIATLKGDALKVFAKLSLDEQNRAIQEWVDLEASKSRKEKSDERPKREVAELPVPENMDTHDVQKFIESLTQNEYASFKQLPREEQERMMKAWNSKGLESLAVLRRSFVDQLDKASLAYFESLSDTAKLEMLYRYRDGAVMEGIRLNGGAGEHYTHDEDGNELRPPSYFIYDKYKNDHGEEYYEVIQEYNRRYNTLTEEQKRNLSNIDRIMGYLWGKFYNTMTLLFDFETRIAEENKKNQEMIRGIVDTGPDYNERIVFAQQQPDGTYLDYNGSPVPAEVVRSMQKKALHNPSRFQALCHYELSKREEPEQARLWEEIFSMMAHHGYNKYAMWGVVVGLQFMNKPSYLAYKNAVIEWMPEYEMGADGHTFVTDDEGRPKPKRYTIDTIIQNGKHVLDPDGKPVKVGDIIRSTTRARFATTELILEPGDQEYDETRPENGRDRYEERTRIIRDKNNVEIRREKYKVKTILKLKEIGFAHELAGKFASYQYGFRSADVAITLDVARHALQTSLSCIRRGDTTSKEFQTSQYVLSRLKMTVDTTRLGGAGTEGMEQNEQNLLAQKQIELLARQAGYSDGELEKGIAQRPNYPPRISGTAEANVLWDELSKVVDRAAEVFPNIRTVLKSDYQAIQDPAVPHHEKGRLEKIGDELERQRIKRAEARIAAKRKKEAKKAS